MGGDWEFISDMMVQMWKMHWMTASLAPDTVTALSVEFGSISLATWTIVTIEVVVMGGVGGDNR